MKWTSLESVTKPLSLLELLATFTFANDKDVENEARASTGDLKVQRQKIANKQETKIMSISSSILSKAFWQHMIVIIPWVDLFYWNDAL